MLAEYNKINHETDSLEVIRGKLEKIREGRRNGEVSDEELEEQKQAMMKVNKEILVGYAFTW